MSDAELEQQHDPESYLDFVFSEYRKGTVARELFLALQKTMPAHPHSPANASPQTRLGPSLQEGRGDL
jgi:hypothetical protein